MNNTINQQQQKQSTSATANPETSTSSTFTAQNCPNYFEKQTQTRMIKNIESSPNNMEWDQKKGRVLRRESVPENTVQVIAENNNSSLVTPISLKSSNDVQTSSASVTTGSTNNKNSEISDDSSCDLVPNNNLTGDVSDESSLESNTNYSPTDNSTSSKLSVINVNHTSPSSEVDPQDKSATSSKVDQSTKGTSSDSNTVQSGEDSISKSSDTSGELVRGTFSQENSVEKSKSSSRLSERAKKKSWYNVIYPNYKSRSQDFKRIFGDLPSDERLIVDYSCALQRDILVQGRLYVSKNCACFYANIFGWETNVIIKWKSVTSITKEKTALVIPNAISISTADEKYFFATFASRDKTFLMLFRIWQNALMNKPMLPQEMWQWVHNCYGDDLGLTTDDEDYIDPKSVTTESGCALEFSSDIEDRAESAVSDYSTANSNSNPSVDQSCVVLNSSGASSNYGTLEYYSNVDETCSQKLDSAGGDCSRVTSNLSQGINQISAVRTSVGSVSRGTKSNKELNSSTATTTSGSDNKVSDNNSSVDSNFRKCSKSYSSNSSKMKPNAKELVLNSAKPEDGSAVSSTNNANVPSSKEHKTSPDGKRSTIKNNRQRDERFSKNSGNLPTDISDSSDSDENKTPFVATAECSSAHEGRQLVHTILPINTETLFNLLFSKSKFLVEFHAQRKSSDIIFGDWTTNEAGQQIRTVNLTVQIAASVGPKTSRVTEYQTLRDCSKPGELYSIDINSENAGIPYADSFSVMLHYCLVRTVDDHTMLSVHAQLKFKKSVWGVVKGFIERNTWACLDDFYTSLLHSLQSETCIPPAKGKGRRPRRGKHKQSANSTVSTTNPTLDTATSTTTSPLTAKDNDNCNQMNVLVQNKSFNIALNNHHQSHYNYHHNHNSQSHNHPMPNPENSEATSSNTTTDNDSLHHSSDLFLPDSSCSTLNHHHLLHNNHHQSQNQNHQKRIFAISEGTAAQIRPVEELPPVVTDKPDTTENMHAQQVQTPRHSTTNHVIPGEPSCQYKWLSLFVIVLLFLLIVIDVILLLKLWKLDRRIEEDFSNRARIPNLSTMSQLPNSPEDWLELVRQQEVLHQTELNKWHKVLQTAIELLKKTEKTLAALMFR